MKIEEITDEWIEFDNGKVIEFNHEQDCCEYNYADFHNIDSIAWGIDFDENLIFERAYGGFRFGSRSTPMFYIPCYSSQNGYYSQDVDIFYNGDLVLNTIGEIE